MGDSGDSSGDSGGGDIFSADSGGDGPAAAGPATVSAPAPAPVSVMSAPAAPVVFVPVFVPVEVPTDIIQSVVSEAAAQETESVAQEASEIVSSVTISAPSTVDLVENIQSPLSFVAISATAVTSNGNTPETPTSFSLPSGQFDNDLFTINGATGELSFVTPPNFESDNSLDILLQAQNGAVIVSQAIAFLITDLETKPRDDFTRINGILSSARDTSTLIRFSDWNDITQLVPGGDIGETAFGQDGTYTFQLTSDATNSSNTGGTLTTATKIVYRVGTKTVDIDASGSLIDTASSLASNVSFDVQIRNEAVQQFVDAGFAVGNMRFATDTSLFGSAVALDADDSLTLTIQNGSGTAANFDLALELDFRKNAGNQRTAVSLEALGRASDSSNTSSVNVEFVQPTITTD